MTDVSAELIRRSGYSHEGFAADYDGHRPSPPPDLLRVLARMAQVDRPRLVVDLGSGTGLSARAWAGLADEVVGVEPSQDIRREAERRTSAANVRFEDAFSNATGLAPASADIVTCAQSLHWMDPEPTFAEAGFVLREGSVFAAYDYELTPVVHLEVEAAFAAFLEARRTIRAELGIPAGAAYHPKEGHLERMTRSGRFRYTRELFAHGTAEGDAARLVGLARSIGPIAVDGRVLDAERELETLAAVADRVIGTTPVQWHFGYRVRVGVK